MFVTAERCNIAFRLAFWRFKRSSEQELSFNPNRFPLPRVTDPEKRCQSVCVCFLCKCSGIGRMFYVQRQLRIRSVQIKQNSTNCSVLMWCFLMTSDTKRGKTGAVMMAERGPFANIPRTLSELNIFGWHLIAQNLSVWVSAVVFVTYFLFTSASFKKNISTWQISCCV